MVKEICHDPIILSRKSTDATPEDIPVADDLADTLKANADRCVGMAANMINVTKNIIVFIDNGSVCEMFNPEIIASKTAFETEEGCLSLSGTRSVKRYSSVKVRWMNREFQPRIKTFSGFTAQIIQHEIDHCRGILI